MQLANTLSGKYTTNKDKKQTFEEYFKGSPSKKNQKIFESYS